MGEDNQMNNALKIIIGLLTAWVVIFPFLAFLAYFGFIFSLISQASQNSYYEPAFPPVFLLIMIFIMCSGFLQVFLQGFYIVHNIVNKTGSDVLRAVLGLGIFSSRLLLYPSTILFISSLKPHRTGHSPQQQVSQLHQLNLLPSLNRILHRK